MELPLSSDENPLSPFAIALSGRKVALNGGKPGAHPMQALAARWRVVAAAIERMADALTSEAFGGEEERTSVNAAWRALLYDATELFDVYAQLIPERISPLPQGEKKKLAEYSATVKRLRDPWALICNRFKHQGAQLAFLRATGGNNLSCRRFIVQIHTDAKSLLRDDVVHKNQRGGMPYVVRVQMLVHDMLRADVAASRLLNGLQDQSCPAEPARSLEIKMGAAMLRLSSMLATVLPGETVIYDSFVFAGNSSVRLGKARAIRLTDPVKFSVTMEGDGVTNVFQFE